MNDTYVDQSALDLNLCLYSGVPDLEGKAHLFKECSREIFPGGMSVRLGIIGASHFFSCRSLKTGFGFTEVLACMEPPPFAGAKQVLPFRILSDGGFGPELDVAFPRSGYRFQGSVRAATPAELTKVKWFKRKLLGLESHGDALVTRVALAHDFSLSEGGDASERSEPFHAETLLLLEIITRSRLKLATVHTYPNEGKIVLTVSELSLVLRNEESTG